MKTRSRVSAAAVSLCALNLYAVVVLAEDSAAPMQQAVESMQKNEAKNPGNAGLENSYSHILKNERRFKEKHEGVHDVHSARVERVERVERPERPERLDPSVRVDRPERGHGHGH